jgi:hypothetical protein
MVLPDTRLMLHDHRLKLSDFSIQLANLVVLKITGQSILEVVAWMQCSDISYEAKRPNIKL